MSCIRCQYGADWRNHVDEDQVGVTALCEKCQAEMTAGDEGSPATTSHEELVVEGPFTCVHCRKETVTERGMVRHSAAKHPDKTMGFWIGPPPAPGFKGDVSAPDAAPAGE